MHAVGRPIHGMDKISHVHSLDCIENQPQDPIRAVLSALSTSQPGNNGSGILSSGSDDRGEAGAPAWT